MSALPPDYDTDPDRWRSWKAPQDVHEIVAPELHGPVLDVGCGEGRLASLAADRRVTWIGVDSSRSQLAANPHRPVVLADLRRLPFRDVVFREVTHHVTEVRWDETDLTPCATCRERYAAGELRPG